MSEAKFYKAEDWEIYSGADKYNFYVQVYDENYNEVPHPANDVNFGGDKWRKVGAQMRKAIKRAEKAGLKRIFELPVKKQKPSGVKATGAIL